MAIKRSNVSRTKIKFRVKHKTNPELKEIVALALDNKAWQKIAQIVSASTKRQTAINLSELNEQVSDGDTIVVPGKILSSGNLKKKIVICGLAISKVAKEKLKLSKSEFIHISEEIKRNPKGEGILIIR